MDRYRLIEPLGTGGMSVVWRAYDEVLGRPVAVKLIKDVRHRERILTEARAAALLCHPHIAQVHDFGHDAGGAPFVVMELVTGRSLEDAVPLPTAETLRLGAELADALTAVHARGLVHRDVKPANILLTAAGAKLVDFGISAVAGDSADAHHELLGTPAYLAPERICGRPTTAATDVYALGLVLYKAITGRHPWPARTTTETLMAHRFARPAPLPPGGTLPPAAAQAILRCLAKAPEDRPSAADMHQVLLAAVPQVPGTADATTRRAAIARRLAPLAAGTAVQPIVARFDDRPAPLSTHLAAHGNRRRAAPLLAAHRNRRRAVAAGALALALGGALATCTAGGDPERGGPAWIAAGAAPAPPPAECLVQYTIRQQRDGTFTADLVLTNAGHTAVPAWTLTFRLPAGHALASAGQLAWRQEGGDVRLTGAGVLAQGASVQTPLAGSYRTPDALPTGFALNDTACRQVLVAFTTGATAATVAPPPVTGAADNSGKSGRSGKRNKGNGGGNEDGN